MMCMLVFIIYMAQILQALLHITTFQMIWARTAPSKVQMYVPERYFGREGPGILR